MDHNRRKKEIKRRKFIWNVIVKLRKSVWKCFTNFLIFLLGLFVSQKDNDKKR